MTPYKYNITHLSILCNFGFSIGVNISDLRLPKKKETLAICCVISF